MLFAPVSGHYAISPPPPLGWFFVTCGFQEGVLPTQVFFHPKYVPLQGKQMTAYPLPRLGY